MALWTPAEISPAMWYDASDASTLFDATTGGSLPANGSAIARWEDKSGNSRHLTQATSARRPTRQTGIQNSLDIIRLNGASTQFINSTATISGTITARHVFVISLRSSAQATASSATTFQRLVSTSNGTGADDFSTGIAMFGALNGSGVPLAYTCDLRTSTDSGVLQNTTIGRNARTNVQNHTGDVGEVVFFLATLSTENRQLMEGYLHWKWGIQANLASDHPYKNSPPTTGIARPKINGSLFNRGLINGSLIR